MTSLKLIDFYLDYILKMNNYISCVSISKYDLEIVKQDLEKYNKVMKLLKELFEQLYIDNSFNENEEDIEYYIHEFGTNSYYFISENLYKILFELKKVGDNL